MKKIVEIIWNRAVKTKSLKNIIINYDRKTSRYLIWVKIILNLKGNAILTICKKILEVILACILAQCKLISSRHFVRSQI